MLFKTGIRGHDDRKVAGPWKDFRRIGEVEGKGKRSSIRNTLVKRA